MLADLNLEASGHGKHVTRLIWRTSRRCGENGECVQVADLPDGGIGVRDSAAPAGPVLALTAVQWRDLVHRAKDGNYDLLS
ncbi:DUF397 domain-containing protein [Spirillospora sp. CA-294931]|uniref:DUF397 domain-containing protein n=1 Tax=Spirillospora sp. CA-294931 TaxID=3240042 RepID=UPI003D8C3A1C